MYFLIRCFIFQLLLVDTPKVKHHPKARCNRQLPTRSSWLWLKLLFFPGSPKSLHFQFFRVGCWFARLLILDQQLQNIILQRCHCSSRRGSRHSCRYLPTKVHAEDDIRPDNQPWIHVSLDTIESMFRNRTTNKTWTKKQQDNYTKQKVDLCVGLNQLAIVAFSGLMCLRWTYPRKGSLDIFSKKKNCLSINHQVSMINKTRPTSSKFMNPKARPCSNISSKSAPNNFIFSYWFIWFVELSHLFGRRFYWVLICQHHLPRKKCHLHRNFYWCRWWWWRQRWRWRAWGIENTWGMTWQTRRVSSWWLNQPLGKSISQTGNSHPNRGEKQKYFGTNQPGMELWFFSVGKVGGWHWKDWRSINKGTCSLFFFIARTVLVGGFNPFEKYWSNWIISPGRDENKKYLKPPPSVTSQWIFFKMPWP